MVNEHSLADLTQEEYVVLLFMLQYPDVYGEN